MALFFVIMLWTKILLLHRSEIVFSLFVDILVGNSSLFAKHHVGNRNRSVSSGVGVARLVVRSAQRQDTGLYTCQASGSLPLPPQPVPTRLIVTRRNSHAQFRT